MRTPPRELITAAFGLSARAEMVPVHFGTTQTWSLDTADGRVLVKQLLDGRPLAGTDDVAAWLGDTLARLHSLGSAPDEPLDWHRLHDPDRWQGWLAEGERQHRPGAVRRTLDAYGRAVPGDPAVTVRRVGISLGRLAGRLRMTLGELPAGPQDLAGLDAQAARRIGTMPAFAVQVAGWSALLRS